MNVITYPVIELPMHPKMIVNEHTRLSGRQWMIKVKMRFVYNFLDLVHVFIQSGVFTRQRKNMELFN